MFQNKQFRDDTEWVACLANYFLTNQNCLATLIVVALLLPVTIHRNKLSRSHAKFNVTFSSSIIHGRHLLRIKPVARPVATSSKDVSDALNLPNGTLVPSDHLQKFAEFRPKIEKLDENLDLYNCDAQPSFIILTLVCFICMSINVTDVTRGTKQRNDCAKFAYAGVVIWMLSLLYFALHLTASPGEIVLPCSNFRKTILKLLSNGELSVFWVLSTL